MLETFEKITVLIVDDSLVMRKIVATALAKDPEMQVIGFAANGEEAIQAVKALNPQAVTLDIEMPIMDGITALKEIRKFAPRLPIIMLSTLTLPGARAAIDALLHGASDYVGKPASSSGMDEAFSVLSESVIPKIKGLVRRIQIVEKETQTPKRLPINEQPHGPKLPMEPPHVGAVCIGVSTGGPAALMHLFGQLDGPINFPIFIVQHMPPMFTDVLAHRLNDIGKLPVVEAEDGQAVRAGHVYLAPGGRHMTTKKQTDGEVVIQLADTPPENSCRPSVDVLFRSVARAYGAASLSMVLTGMGQDGLKGVRDIRAAGGLAYAQDEESSVVWGMPGAVVREGLADKVLPLSQMAREIMRHATAVGQPD